MSLIKNKTLLLSVFQIRGRFFADISEMISLIKVTVEDFSKKAKENEKIINDLEQYSRSNCLIFHCRHHASNGVMPAIRFLKILLLFSTLS